MNSENNNGLNMPVGGNNVNQSPIPEPIEMIDSLDMDGVQDQNGMIGGVKQAPVNFSVPQPSAPVAPVEVSPVPPIAPMEPIIPMDTPMPQPVNDFSSMPVFNDIGTVPPISNVPNPGAPKEKKKGGVNKLLFVIIIVLALTAVGVGVYIFLHLANKSEVTTKLVNIEIGTSVSTNMSDYAIFDGVDASTCSLDTTSITDTSVLNAEYSYKVICGEATYTGTAKIVDTVAPSVELKEVSVASNKEVKPEDFIESVEDETECIYSFKDEDKVKEYLKEESSYHVDIVVKDAAGNEIVVTGTMIVSNTVADLYLVCSSNVNNLNVTNKFGLVSSEFNKVATRIYTFNFDNIEAYNSFKEENEGNSEVTYNDVTGTPEFNDDVLSLDLTVVLSYEDLNKEENTTLPLGYADLRGYYEGKGYTCSIGY